MEKSMLSFISYIWDSFLLLLAAIFASDENWDKARNWYRLREERQ